MLARDSECFPAGHDDSTKRCPCDQLGQDASAFREVVEAIQDEEDFSLGQALGQHRPEALAGASREAKVPVPMVAIRRCLVQRPSKAGQRSAISEVTGSGTRHLECQTRLARPGWTDDRHEAAPVEQSVDARLFAIPADEVRRYPGASGSVPTS